MSSARVARGLRLAEERLRASGRMGGAAFDALVAGLTARRRGEPVDEDVADALADIPDDPSLDLFGLAYERFFSDLFKGLRGQFFTPRPLAELLVSRLGVEPGDTVLDPTCGSGGLLVVAAARGARVHGVEIDPRLARLASLNLLLSGIEGDIRCADAFHTDLEPVDVVVANPPFSVRLIDDAGRRTSSDAAFLKRLHAWVRPGGRAGVVLPWSVIANPTHAELRQSMLRHFDLAGVCALPEGVFRPFGGAQGRAALVWWVRHPAKAPSVAWGQVRDPGYDVTSRRLQTTSGDDLARLSAGLGWVALPPGSWQPRVSNTPRSTVRDHATWCDERCYPGRAPDASVTVLDLGDTERALGEVTSLQARDGRAIRGVRLRLKPGQVLVSRMRPRLGNVVVVPRRSGAPLVGSPEWVPLQTAYPRVLFHLLRTPSWRRSLPMSTGQTRPRIHPDDVLDSPVPWPPGALADRLERVSQALADERERLRLNLEQLQSAVDAYAAGTLDDTALDAVLTTLHPRATDDSTR